MREGNAICFPQLPYARFVRFENAVVLQIDDFYRAIPSSESYDWLRGMKCDRPNRLALHAPYDVLIICPKQSVWHLSEFPGIISSRSPTKCKDGGFAIGCEFCVLDDVRASTPFCQVEFFWARSGGNGMNRRN